MDIDQTKHGLASQLTESGSDILVPLLAGVAVSAVVSILMDLSMPGVWRWIALVLFAVSALLLLTGQTGAFEARRKAAIGARSLNVYRERLDERLKIPRRFILLGHWILALGAVSLLLDYWLA